MSASSSLSSVVELTSASSSLTGAGAVTQLRSGDRLVRLRRARGRHGSSLLLSTASLKTNQSSRSPTSIARRSRMISSSSQKLAFKRSALTRSRMSRLGLGLRGAGGHTGDPGVGDGVRGRGFGDGVRGRGSSSDERDNDDNEGEEDEEEGGEDREGGKQGEDVDEDPAMRDLIAARRSRSGTLFSPEKMTRRGEGVEGCSVPDTAESVSSKRCRSEVTRPSPRWRPRNRSILFWLDIVSLLMRGRAASTGIRG
ncbi:hypothetical protein BJ166DRAFT_284994 [Pestalotiopsis sp. NC0098]|nr:hypothetical protein BJ166DRAFT_284994 [Pestalotiopsis sp. NC0098]